MKTTTILLRLLLALTYVPMTSFGPAPVPGFPRAIPAKRALLVGIDQYAGLDAAYQLHGCVSDITLMQDLLIQRGFLKENIQFLPNKKASKKAILAAFDALIKATNPDDIVVVHFSCHGSQMLDLRNRELDGLSETLIPTDYVNTSADARRTSLADYEMDSLLTLLTAKTKKITVILDACHSYGATRHFSRSRARLVEPVLSHQDSVVLMSIRARATGVTPTLKKNNAAYTLIAGCTSSELSNEYDRPDNTSYGALTWFLVSELRRTDGAQRWPDIIQNVRTNVQSIFPGQTPQLGGTNADAFVFGDNTYVNHQFYYVSPRPDGLVDLHGGAAYGFEPGSTFKVYAPGTTDFEKSTPVAEIELTGLGAFNSTAKVLSGAIRDPNCKAQELSHNFTNVDLNLRFAGDWGHLGDIKTAVTTLPSVKEDAENPNLLLQAGVDGIRITLARDTTRILDELSLGDASNNNGLVNTIKSWQHWFHVLRIQNPANQVNFTASLHVVSHSRIVKDITDQLYHPDYVFEDGDTVELRITNLSNNFLYFHVLDLQDDGVIAPYTFGVLAGWGSNDYIKPKDSRSAIFPMSIRPGRLSALDVMKIYATTNNAVKFDCLAPNSTDFASQPDEVLMSRDIGVTRVALDYWGTLTKILLTK